MSGLKIALPVGNRSGIDHFPYPVRSRAAVEALRDAFQPTTDLDDFYPVNVDLATLMILTWRVKQLQLTACATNAEYDYIIHSVGSGDSAHTVTSIITLNALPDNFGFDDAADETALVNGLHFNPELDLATTLMSPGFQTLQHLEALSDLTADGVEEIDPITDPAFQPIFSVAFLANADLTSNIIYDDSVDPAKPFWPSLTLFCSFPGGVFDYAFGSKRDAADGTATINLGDTGKTIVIPLAYSFASHLNDDPGVVTYETTEASGTVTFSIDAKKFFPFQNSAGASVYDETTGIVLTDPFG